MIIAAKSVLNNVRKLGFNLSENVKHGIDLFLPFAHLKFAIIVQITISNKPS